MATAATSKISRGCLLWLSSCSRMLKTQKIQNLATAVFGADRDELHMMLDPKPDLTLRVQRTQ